MPESFEQIEIPKDFVGERAAFLQDGMEVKVESYEGKPISVKLPQSVVVTIVEADPVREGTDGCVVLQDPRSSRTGCA